jgi:hypothetical protein
LVAALVLAADAWQGKRWFDESARVARARRQAGPSAAPRARSAAAPGAVLGRLIWQELRQSWKLLLAFAALAVPVTLLFWSNALHPSGKLEFASWLPFPELLVPVIALLTILAIPLAGACVFLADQSGCSFRFLADRGVGPRVIWMSRQMVWAGAVVLIVLLLVFPPLLVIGMRSILQHDAMVLRQILVVPGFIFLQILLIPGLIFFPFSCGQLCSMFIRSGIVAAVASVVLTASMCAWAGFMFMLTMSWWWSVAPLPVVFWAATWLWAPHWLVERSGWRSRVREIAPVVAPLVLILVAIPFVRVYQIPEVDPGVSLEESAHPVTPEEKATAELYLKAQGQMFEATGKLNRLAGSLAAAPVGNSPPGVAMPSPAQFSVEAPKNESDAALTKSEAAWLQANQEALALVLQASQRKNASFDEPVPLAAELTRLVVLSARQLESEGKLDAALDRYLAALRVCYHLWQRQRWQQNENLERPICERLVWWATRRGQTRAQIVTAIRRLREAAVEAPSPYEEIESGYRRTRQMLDNVADLKPASRSDDEPLLRFALRWLPWERARVVRQLNFWTTECLTDCRRWEKAAAVNGQVILAEDDRTLHFSDCDYVADVWVDYTPFAWSWQAVNTSVANGETERRVTQILLALEGWKTEHGQLPASLDKLVGPYFDVLPNDPFTGKPFRYFPNGVPIPLTRQNGPYVWMSAAGGAPIPRDTPFIWSAGWDLSEVGDELRDRRYPIGLGPIVSGDDIYQRAWIFVIPGP